jgi:anionic cell wall polymer biosynthesis LytR-Cps2A-Psr (LCP) family protein
MHTSRLQRIEQRKGLLKIGLLIGSVIILLFIGFALVKFLGFYNKIHTGAQAKPNEKQKEQTDFTFLLLGYGGGNHEGTYLTDTIMVANVNIETKKVTLISIPRDIWVKVPTKTEPFHSKINAVYQMGLFPENYPDLDKRYLTTDNPSGVIKKVIEDVTGLHVDGFAAVDFQGFIETIDTLGGIDVNVENTFTDYEYPIEGKEADLCGKDEEFKQIEPYLKPGFNEDEKKKLFSEKPEIETFFNNIQDNPVEAFPCRYETLKFDKGETHLDGVTALKFARSRHSLDDGGDFNRAKRQQKVLEAVKEKVLSINFIPKIIPLLNDLEDHIITDIPLSETNKLLLEARNAETYTIETFVISDDYLMPDYSDNGQYIVIPTSGMDDWSAIRTKIDHIRKGITPTPTKAPITKSPTPQQTL